MTEQELSPHLENLQKILHAELSTRALTILNAEGITLSIFNMTTLKDLKWALAGISGLTAGDKLQILHIHHHARS